MFLQKDEFMARIKEKLGVGTDDESLSILEDASDTYDGLASRSTDMEDWKQKFEENDNEWRNKYRERFLTTAEEVNEEQEEDVEKDSKVLSFDDLFEKREG